MYSVSREQSSEYELVGLLKRFSFMMLSSFEPLCASMGGRNFSMAEFFRSGFSSPSSSVEASCNQRIKNTEDLLGHFSTSKWSPILLTISSPLLLPTAIWSDSGEKAKLVY